MTRRSAWRARLKKSSCCDGDVYRNITKEQEPEVSSSSTTLVPHPGNHHRQRPTLTTQTALATVTDRRQRRGIRYIFTELLPVRVPAVLAGAQSLTMIAKWVADAHHRNVLTTGARTPLAATLHRVTSTIDPVTLGAAVSSWIRSRIDATSHRHGHASDCRGRVTRTREEFSFPRSVP